jgi:ornithine cyclodeaminase
VSAPPFYDAAAISRLLPPAEAVDALEAALRGGLDEEADPPRTGMPTPAGRVMLMPSAALGSAAGVKLATVAAENPRRGLPRINGVYALFDGETLVPTALLDGIGLTNVRTAAVTALAARLIADPASRRLVVFGRGPQSGAHVEALRAVLPIEHVDVLGRDDDRAPVAEADVICCCTTAREPLFDGDAVRDGAAVLAIGSHEAEAREVDERVAARAGAVLVESRSSALREAGDVIQAIAAGAIGEGDLVTLSELVRGDARLPGGGPRFYKGTGMAWQDLVVAAAVHARG